MDLLRTLTLGYVAVLILALAASLITILWYLWQIGTVLGDTRAALLEVRDRTQPLQDLLSPVGVLRPEAAEPLQAAADALRQADRHLADALAPSRADAA